MTFKLLQRIINYRNQLKNFFKKHSEYVGILIALVILWIFPPLIRSIDPSAAPVDPGILSAILLAVVAVMIFKSVTWWLIKAIWPVFAIYSQDQFIDDFKNLTACQKILIYLGFYTCLFLSFVLALVAIL